MMQESVFLKALTYFPKIFGAMVGVVLSLILSEDIDKEGKLLLSKSVLLKFSCSVFFSLYGGEACIEHFSLYNHSIIYQGFIFLLFGLFGMLVIGVVYQSLALLKGKPLSEIVKEVKEAFFSIFRN